MISSTTCPFVRNNISIPSISISHMSFWLFWFEPTIKFDCRWPLGLAKSCDVYSRIRDVEIFPIFASILTNACLNTTNGMEYISFGSTHRVRLRTCVLHIQYNRSRVWKNVRVERRSEREKTNEHWIESFAVGLSVCVAVVVCRAMECMWVSLGRSRTVNTLALIFQRSLNRSMCRAVWVKC